MNRDYILPKNEILTQCRVNGDCMAGAGIDNGDIVVVDCDRFPKENTPCLCKVDGNLMVKLFLKTMSPGVYTVGTCYDFGCSLYDTTDRGFLRMNRGYFTSEIVGVVLYCTAPDGSLRWANDYRDFPKKSLSPGPQLLRGQCVGVAKA